MAATTALASCGRDADIFQHARQGVAGIQGDGAAFHAGIGIGIVGIVGCWLCGSLARISFMNRA